MARTKTSRNRHVKRPKVATLFCAEALRAPACVVVDALTVRGWSVRLQTGDAAREALKRFRDPKAGLRVLCLPEPLNVAAREALRKALDPLHRGDLLIVDFFTPRTVVEHVLTFSGYRVGPRRRTLGRRTTRSYLAQPTLLESAVDVGYWSLYGVVAAAAGVAILGGISTFWAMKPDLALRPQPTTVAADTPRALAPRRRRGALGHPAHARRGPEAPAGPSAPSGAGPRRRARRDVGGDRAPRGPARGARGH